MATAIKIRKPYERHPRVTIDTGTVSRVKQSFKDETDINAIMARYIKTGVLDHIKENPGIYADLPVGADYQEALDIVIAAGEAFDELPGTVRRRFQNNAVQFLEFMDDPEMVEESYELGLRIKEVVVEPPLEPEPLAEVDPPAAE